MSATVTPLFAEDRRERDPALPGPVRVAVVDLAQPLTALDCTRADGGRYEHAWILAVRDGQPVGLVQAPIDAPALSPDALGDLLARELGAAFSTPSAHAADAPPDVALPSVTVVVPTVASRTDELLECARRLSALDYPDFEVVVVDNRRAPGQGDEALAQVAALAHVRVVAQRRPGISAARNAGLRAATGDVIAYTDDDVEVDARWLTALGRRFAADPQAAAVTGLVMPKELETPAQVWFERSGSGLDRSYAPLTFESEHRRRPGAGAFSPSRFRVVRRAAGQPGEQTGSLYATGEFGIGSNMAFRADVLRAQGGFDLALGAGTPTCGGEDLAMLLEILASGQRLVHDPAAIVHHIHRREVHELERQLRGYGVGLTATLVALMWRDPRHVAGVLGVVPAGLRSMLRPEKGKRSKQADGYPEHLVGLEMRGMLRGPWAYLVSRRAQRGWTP
jgi:GT2 family glycosyltransferase